MEAGIETRFSLEREVEKETVSIYPTAEFAFMLPYSNSASLSLGLQLLFAFYKDSCVDYSEGEKLSMLWVQTIVFW